MAFCRNCCDNLTCCDFCLIKCEIESDSIGNDTNKYKIFIIDLKFEINSILYFILELEHIAICYFKVPLQLDFIINNSPITLTRTEDVE